MLKAHGDKNHTALEQLSVGGGGGWRGSVWEGFVAFFFFFKLLVTESNQKTIQEQSPRKPPWTAKINTLWES